MKRKISISIEEQKVRELDELLKKSKFRNKSHVVEIALEKLLEGER
ncbi:MAG: ribbon-helix-helix domain-containing protein [Nanoarchaeota archaeon]|nr:ribbon-helix-helix domain-containing protein [Nanoarchaeota archaeon]MBU0977731.1 ribbon-helix-helix domain-containing protein [Nanoarchaeota archaeon]